MIATVPSAVLLGVEGAAVSVEVHVSNGLPGFTVVGLPDAAVRESRDRVRAALLSSGLTWPRRRVTVNLAPGGVRKSGAGLDLPIAVGVLVASGAVDPDATRGLAFVGELGLDGSLRGVPGTVVLAESLADHDLVVPTDSAVEAVLGGHPGARLAPTLRAVVDGLEGRRPWIRAHQAPAPAATQVSRNGAHPVPVTAPPDRAPSADLVDVRGQQVARRALEVAAAGGHHLVMVGPPGAGKTLLASCLPGLLPDLDRATALEVTRVHSVAGLPLPPGGLVDRPPFRAPHHGATSVAMVGGGTAGMRPGEISLAHTRLYQCRWKEVPSNGTSGRVRIKRRYSPFGARPAKASLSVVAGDNAEIFGAGSVLGEGSFGPSSWKLVYYPDGPNHPDDRLGPGLISLEVADGSAGRGPTVTLVGTLGPVSGLYTEDAPPTWVFGEVSSECDAVEVMCRTGETVDAAIVNSDTRFGHNWFVALLPNRPAEITAHGEAMGRVTQPVEGFDS